MHAVSLVTTYFFSTTANSTLKKELITFPLLATFGPCIIIYIIFAKRTARLDYLYLNIWNEGKGEMLEREKPKINHLSLYMCFTVREPMKCFAVLYY